MGGAGPMYEACYKLAWRTATGGAPAKHLAGLPAHVTQNEALVHDLRARRVLHDARVEAALLSVPREAFLPPEVAQDAALDAPLPIGEGQTISAPHMVVMMAEALDVRPGHRILEVGGGSGYHAAVLARLATPGGSIVTIERHEALVEQARRNLARLGDPPKVEFVLGDGSEGVPDRAPFDRISVAAAAPAIPKPLLDQLKPGGRLVVPVGNVVEQDLLCASKRADGEIDVESLGPVRFVPLLGRHGFRE